MRCDEAEGLTTAISRCGREMVLGFWPRGGVGLCSCLLPRGAILKSLFCKEGASAPSLPPPPMWGGSGRGGRWLVFLPFAAGNHLLYSFFARGLVPPCIPPLDAFWLREGGVGLCSWLSPRGAIFYFSFLQGGWAPLHPPFGASWPRGVVWDVGYLLPRVVDWRGYLYESSLSLTSFFSTPRS